MISAARRPATDTESVWPALILQAQYMNLLDRLVRSAEVRMNTKCALDRAHATAQIKRNLSEIAQTLSNFCFQATSPVDTVRVRRAQSVYADLLDAAARPAHDTPAYQMAANAVATLVLAYPSLD